MVRRVLVVCSGVVWGWAQVPYAVLPQWESAPRGLYATGLAAVDLTGDGLPELVVACGNDMARQPVYVYVNRNGLPERTPSWSSADSGYHGHVAVADVDGDGWADVAVTEYLGAGGWGVPGGVKLYRNRQGELERLPSWRARERFSSFRCAWGDVDGDGRPDLAVAGGEAYSRVPEPVRLYRNRNGMLEDTASWQSADTLYAYDLTWEDFNGDGWLDLVVACARGASRIYYNRGGTLEQRPGWIAAETEFANSLAVGDVDGDGWVDVAISYNRQLGGSGQFVLFRNRGGQLEMVPSWRSQFSGYGSGIALLDVNGDGAADLLTGAWWDTVRIYLNHGGSIAPEPSWRSQTRSVVEAFAVADVNADGLDTVRWRLGRGANGPLIRLPAQPVERIVEVWAAGRRLLPSEFVAQLSAGWLSVPVAFGDTVEVVAWISHRRDIAVSNWDPDQGDFLFLWQEPQAVETTPVQGLRVRVALESHERLEVELFLPEAGWVVGEWVTVLGQRLPAFEEWGSAGWVRVVLAYPAARGLWWLRVQMGPAVVCLPLLRL
jgi:hypothetical protein